MTDTVLVDSRLKNKIEELMDLSMGDIECYSVRFKDLDDAFHFGKQSELQDFLREQEVERFYDKSLRKGYFDYVNENGETLRYHVEAKRGTFTLIKDECLGILN